MTTMPSETITAIAGSVVGAALVLVGYFGHVELPAEVAGAVTTLVAWTAFGITLVVKARRKPDGTP